jgi:hypothetical protein
MARAPTPKHGTFFGPLPRSGIWTAIALTRAQFLLILVLSVVLFVFIGGPVWAHAHESHFWRIGLSYAVIPAAVAAALHRNREARPVTIVVASAVIALVKLVVTAALLVIAGMAGV